MNYWTEYEGHKVDIRGKKKKVDNTIYTFDIETSSYLILDGKQVAGCEYNNLTEEEQEACEKRSTMYIWMFSINEDVYYGRSWAEFRFFLKKLELTTKEKKIIFVHNLAYEFQFLKGEFEFKEVLARKAHKVMKCEMCDFNIEFRCSYMMSNCALKYLPELFKLPVEKMVGDLDYNLIRNTYTDLTEKELKYCEHDCLVVYYYIKTELLTYNTVDKIPMTSTGHVRRELKELVMKDFKYKRIVNKAINEDPHIYNLLIDAFAGRIYTC